MFYLYFDTSPFFPRIGRGGFVVGEINDTAPSQENLLSSTTQAVWPPNYYNYHNYPSTPSPSSSVVYNKHLTLITETSEMRDSHPGR